MEMIDLSIELFNNMPTHRNYPNLLIIPHVRHEDSKTIQTNGHSVASIYLAMIDHSGTHVEGLANLETVVNRRFTFIGLPLKVRGGSGSPIRAVAMLD